MTSNPSSADAPECLHVRSQPCCPKSIAADSKCDDNRYCNLPAPELAGFLFPIVVKGIGASTRNWMTKCELLEVGAGYECVWGGH